MTSDLVLGVDLGTSAAKAALLDLDGRVLATAHRDYPTSQLHPGWAEQAPADWWRATVDAVRECGHGDRVAALGFTGQMQDLICLDEARTPVRPAILYSDLRATVEHQALSQDHPGWAERAGNHQDPSNLAAKLAWLTGHEPETLQRTSAIVLGAPGAVIAAAGGELCCDPTTAATTGLLDIARRQWNAEVLGELPAKVLPSLTDGAAGTLSGAAAAELGLLAGLPLAHAPGDAGATTDALIGLEPQSGYAYLGTSGWVAAVVPDEGPWVPDPIHALALPGWANRLRIGAVLSAGAAADWSRRTFLAGAGFAEADLLAADRYRERGWRTLPLALPGLAGERTPVRDDDVRGTFVGATPETNAIDFHLAVLAGVALNLRLAANRMGLEAERLPVVGGGAASPVWRQLLADAFGVPVLASEDSADQGASRSAARWAADVAGLEHRIAPLFTGSSFGVTEPLHPVTPGRLALHRALYDALGPVFRGLAGRETSPRAETTTKKGTP